jgi:hypothetical protein
MVSAEVQRTLVKSPPELWSELSDPIALTRHLGEFGDIRITRTLPEKRVEWDAPLASGTVDLAASGWGTKVSLTATREIPPPITSDDAAASAAAAADLDSCQPTHDSTAVADEQAVPIVDFIGTEEGSYSVSRNTGAVSRYERGQSLPTSTIEQPLRASLSEPADDEASTDHEPPHQAELAREADPGPETPAEPQSDSRRGFLARLFRRARKPRDAAGAPESDPDSESPATQAVEPVIVGAAQAVEPAAAGPATAEAAAPAARETMGTSEPDDALAVPTRESTAAPVSVAEEPPDISAELLAAELLAAELLAAELLAAEQRAAEQLVAEHTTAVLTAVLDRLGAAHHRPFSRG